MMRENQYEEYWAYYCLTKTTSYTSLYYFKGGQTNESDYSTVLNPTKIFGFI